MKRKNSKKSGIIAAVVGLSAVSLVSVGFASWIISGGDTANVDGTIAVEQVSDARYLIETGSNAPAVAYGDEDGNDVKDNPATSIVYGIDDSTSISGAWLKAGGTGDNAPKYENLKAKITFYVANLKDKTIGTDYDLNATIVASGAKASAFNTAVSDGLVELPVITKNTSFTVHSDETHDTTVDGTTYKFTKVTLALEFKWGTYFGKDGDNKTTNTNPYVFYNTGHKSTDSVSETTTYGDDAKAKLEEIFEANGATFTVTLTSAVHA